jgi:hypothetical protein
MCRRIPNANAIAISTGLPIARVNETETDWPTRTVICCGKGNWMPTGTGTGWTIARKNEKEKGKKNENEREKGLPKRTKTGYVTAMTIDSETETEIATGSRFGKTTNSASVTGTCCGSRIATGMHSVTGM